MLNCDEATGARRQKASPSQICIAEAMQALVWARPVEHRRGLAGDWPGVKGPAPLGCLPLWGREGVTIPIQLSALWEGFPMKIVIKNRFFYPSGICDDCCRPLRGSISGGFNYHSFSYPVIRPAISERPRGGDPHYIRFSRFGCELPFMWVSTEPFLQRGGRGFSLVADSKESFFITVIFKIFFFREACIALAERKKKADECHNGWAEWQAEFFKPFFFITKMPDLPAY